MSSTNREHLAPTTTESTAAASELLILSLDLVKNRYCVVKLTIVDVSCMIVHSSRVAVMGLDMRKAFIGTILVGLIEKSPDVKVMKAITKMLEDWMKNKDVRMQNQVEKTAHRPCDAKQYKTVEEKGRL